MSYYNFIDGIKMDAKLLKEGEKLKGVVDNPVELNAVIKTLVDSVKDGRKVTKTEFDTLFYLNRRYLGNRDTMLKSVLELLELVLPAIYEGEKEAWSYDRP
jgi:hypothetical protein